MKSLMLASFVAAQVSASNPASAASPDQLAATRVDGGMFAGARLRVPLGGASPAKPRLMLSLAPVMRSQSVDGRSQLRFGEGVAFGFSGGERVSLSVAGKPWSTFSGRRGSVDRKNASGVSTLGTVALVGAGVLVALGVALLAYSEAMDCDEDEECS